MPKLFAVSITFFIELLAPIKDQIARRRVVRERLAQLLDDPGTVRMLGHIAVEDSPPIMRNDEEAVQNAKVSVGTMKKSIAAIASRWLLRNAAHRFGRLGIARRFSHPAQHGSLGNIEAKHLQFSMNAWRSQGWVLGDHAEDQFAQFPAYALSSRVVPTPREPRPITNLNPARCQRTTVSG